MKNKLYRYFRRLAPVALAAMMLGCASSDPLPAVNEEGMDRVEARRVDSVYVNPDADFSEFKRFAIAEVDVAFRRNWLRDQNKVRRTHRVTQEDANRIKQLIAGEFRRIFTEELGKGGYTVVPHDNFDNSDRDLLILRPDILDLDVAAPDTRASGINRSFTASAGSMTLSLEFHDAVSGTLLGRITDSREAPDRGFVQISNSVTNKTEADRILRRWARMLVARLDKVHGK